MAVGKLLHTSYPSPKKKAPSKRRGIKGTKDVEAEQVKPKGPSLLVHANVFTVAMKYCVAGLSEVAECHFNQRLE